MNPSRSISPGSISTRSSPAHTPLAASHKRKTSRATDSGGERKKTTRACDCCKTGQPPAPLPASAILSSHENTEHCESYLEITQRNLTSEMGVHIVRDESILPPDLTPSTNEPEPGATDLEGHYLGPGSGISFLNRAWQRLNQNSTTSVPYNLRNEIPRNAAIFTFGDRPFVDFHEACIKLPSRKRADELIVIFFDFALATYRFLHFGTIQSWLSELYEREQSQWKKMSAKAAAIFMVFAMALLHEEQQAPRDAANPEADKSEIWYYFAKRMLSVESGPPKLESVQARFVQCLFLLASSRANQCWYTFGTTVHLSMALGLHRRRSAVTSKGLRQDGGYIRNECRRPRHFHDEDIDQDYPDEINDEDMTPDGPAEERGRSDCVMTATVSHARLSRILGEISRQVYSIRPIPECARLEIAERLTHELKEWRASLPPLLSSIRPSSLIRPFRRQNTVLKLLYAHAIIHANRPFLLSKCSDGINFSSNVEIDRKIEEHIRTCVEAAKTVVDTVNHLAELFNQTQLFEAFWFTHYAAFCAVVVLYVYIIQQYRNKKAQQDPSTCQNLLFLSERCQRTLAVATKRNCPSWRYSIILEELRLDVHRQIDRLLPQFQLDSTRKERVPPGPETNIFNATPRTPLSPFSQDHTQALGHTTYRPTNINSHSAVMPDIPNSNTLDMVDPSTESLVDQVVTPELFENWELMDWAQLDSFIFETDLATYL
ncbi:MAG: hypothetical protein M1834_008645 [Cirrosporium novae-zelandiae]|nr:MAG: hypothetical protein M1834_008645 [Cirrosporium novae-zelandiae]